MTVADYKEVRARDLRPPCGCVPQDVSGFKGGRRYVGRASVGSYTDQTFGWEMWTWARMMDTRIV